MKVVYSLTDQDFDSTKSLGILNVSLNLLRALATCSEIDSLLILSNKTLDLKWTANYKHIKVLYVTKNGNVPKKWKRVWWDQCGVVRVLRALRPDWTIFPKGFSPYLKGVIPGKVVAYVHDVMWEYYAGTPDCSRFFPFLERHYFNRLSLATIQHADVVCTSSQFNVKRFKALVPQAQVQDVGLGFVEKDYDPVEINEKKDVLLYVSVWPHKLTVQALSWLSRWGRETNFKGQVHLLGRLPENAILDPQIKWVRHGRLSDAEMNALISQKILGGIFFSAYEGFGMPPVELGLRGVPCLASDIPPIRENVPESWLFSNKDYCSFAEKMSDLIFGRLEKTRPSIDSWETVAGRLIKLMKDQF